MVLGQFFLHIPGMQFWVLDFPWMLASVCLVEMLRSWVVPPFLVLFLILLSLQPPSLFPSYFPFLFPPSLNTIRVLRTFSWLSRQPLPLAILALVLASQLRLHLFGYSRNHPFGRQYTLYLFIYFQGRSGSFYVMLNVPLDGKHHGFSLIYLGISKLEKSTNLHSSDKLCSYQTGQTITMLTP